MGNIRIFIIVSFCMTSLSILPLFAGIPHTAYGVVEYSDASNPSAISFNAFITSRPSDILTESSSGCGYSNSTGQWWIQCGNFSTSWAVGDVLHVDFDDGLGGTGSVEVTLTSNAADDAGIIILTGILQQITIGTNPAGLMFTVDSETYNSTQVFQWTEGSQHTLSANSFISGGTGIQYVFNFWSDGGDQTHVYTVPSSDETLAVNFNTQYYLTVNSLYGSPAGEGWYNEGISAFFSISTPVSGGPGTQFVFTEWTGSGFGAYTGSSASSSVIMNNPITETVGWQTQYYLATSENPDAGGDIIPLPPGGWYDVGTIVPVDATVLGGYQWAGWSGDLLGSSKPTTIMMNGPKSVTANFGKAVQVTIQTDPPGLAYTVNGTPYSSSQTFTWVENTTYTLSVNSPQGGGVGEQYTYASWSDGGTQSHSYIVPGSNQTVTANFELQYYLTVNSPYGSPVGAGWYTQGSIAAFAVTTPADGGVNTQYVFTEWSGSGSGSYTGNNAFSSVIMNNPISETAVWTTQYYLATSENPPEGGDMNPSPPGLWIDTNTIVDINASTNAGYDWAGWTGSLTGSENPTTIMMNTPKTVTANFILETTPVTVGTDPVGLTFAVDGESYNDTQVFQWEEGTQHTFSVNSPQVGGEGVRFIFDSWSDAGEPSHVYTVTSSADIVMALFETQYFLTVNSEYGSPAGEGWYQSGSNATFSIISPINEGGDIEHQFVGWGGTGSGSYTGPQMSYTVTMNNPILETAAWLTKYFLSTLENPDEGGDVIPAPPGVWYDEGAIAEISASVFEGYQWIGWTGTLNATVNPVSVVMDQPHQVIAHFQEGPVQVTIGTVPPGMDFIVDDVSYNITQIFTWEQGSQHILSVLSPQPDDPGTQYVFQSWSHRGAQTQTYTTPSVNADLKVYFKKQHYLTVNSPYGIPQGEGWYNAGSQAGFSITSPASGGAGVRHLFTGWTGLGINAYTGAEDSATVIMNYPITEVASWKTQYFLFTTENPPNRGDIFPSPPGAWYDNLTTVEVHAVNKEGFKWYGWSGDLTGDTNPTTILMDNPKYVTANFWNEVDITIRTFPSGVEFIVDDTSYNSVQVFSWQQGTKHTISVESPQFINDDERYFFNYWNIGGPQDQNYIVPSSDRTIWASFTEQYLLDVQSLHGSPFGQGWYEKNSIVQFGISDSAVFNGPYEKYLFQGWEGIGSNAYSGKNLSHEVYLYNPIREIAQWDTLYRLEIDIHPDTAGTIVRIPNKTWYKKGESILVIAQTLSDPSYLFQGWSGDLESANDTLFLVMDQPYSVQAVYTPVTHQFTEQILPDPAYGSIEIQPDASSFLHRTTVLVQATAHPGYTFNHWSRGLQGTNPSAQMEIVSDTTVIAHFTIWDTIAPYIVASSPLSGAKMVAVNSPIHIYVMDDISGVDLSTLMVLVQRKPIVQNGSDKTNGLVSITSQGKGYNIIYTPGEGLPLSSDILVEVICEDLADQKNRLSILYSFTTGAYNVYQTAKETVNSAGGTVSDTSGVQVIIPEGGLAQPTEITIGYLDNPPPLPDSLHGVGQVHFFGPEGFVFQTPVTLVLPYSEDDLKSAGVLDVNELRIFYFSTTAGNWVELSVHDIDQANRVVTVRVAHFSYFQIAVWSDAFSTTAFSGFAKVFNFPNPFNPAETSTYIYYELSGDDAITIKIYDVAGSLVTSLISDFMIVPRRQPIEWNGRNDLGYIVANNVYFCVFESEKGDRVIRKIAVLR